MLKNVVSKISYMIVLVFLIILITESARACLIPVFRFGLETWPPNDYELIVFHRGPMSKEDALIIKNLKELKSSAHANFTVYTADVSGEVPDWLQDLWKGFKAPELPLLVVKYPPQSKSYRGSIWSGRLSEVAVRKVLDSSARQEIAKKLLGGDAVVWVLIESGDSTKDDAAAKLISEQLSIINNELTLSPELINIAEVCNLEIDIHFSLIRVSRDDLAEEVFINMLMYSEPGLLELQSSPMVFPVFVRGRALGALVGKGIKEKFIREVCEFVINACACEIKDDNPGVDLLIAVDWEAGIGTRWVDEEIPLVGSIPLTSMARSDESFDLTASTSANYKPEVHNTTSSRLLRNIIITVLAIFVVVIAISIILRPGKER